MKVTSIYLALPDLQLFKLVIPTLKLKLRIALYTALKVIKFEEGQNQPVYSEKVVVDTAKNSAR